ncbi:hypothetical protein PMW_171 [Pseudomonas phage phiPMW]|uniref:Uncharacterized protein n=1 Tax=Pseudomonas phage phiPMW TaxID=1815582 RepID=A0A1S5R1L8_9CAUD|nr:hypothetical protein FDG97_gp179 [Pseudomonas phage phiPMW]ANA49296.1 hypothetical protein PMW_171 [Pseudomonas phage phiPMW]
MKNIHKVVSVAPGMEGFTLYYKLIGGKWHVKDYHDNWVLSGHYMVQKMLCDDEVGIGSPWGEAERDGLIEVSLVTEDEVE